MELPARNECQVGRTNAIMREYIFAEKTAQEVALLAILSSVLKQNIEVICYKLEKICFVAGYNAFFSMFLEHFRHVLKC